MSGFLETHRYLSLTARDGRRIRVTAAYVRMLEESPIGGTLITVADQESTRHVLEDIETLTKLLEQGSVRYAEVNPNG